MRLSNRSSDGDCWVVAPSVTDEGPQDVHASPGQGEDGLGVPLALGALALVEAAGGVAGTDADERGGVEDALQSAVVAAGPVQVAADPAGVAGHGGDSGEAGQPIRGAEAAEVASRG